MEKGTRKLCFLTLIFFLASALAIGAWRTEADAADVAVIANGKVPDSSLSPDQIKAIYLGQATSMPSGAKVEFVTLKDASEIHEEFLTKYVGRSAAQFSNYWKQQVFTGKGRMPKQFDSEASLVEYVSANDGAIGYVLSATPKGSAKTISIK